MSNIQNELESSSKQLKEIFKDLKIAKDTLKEMKSELKKTMMDNSEWLEKERQIKVLKNSKKDIQEQLKELERGQDQIASKEDYYQEVQEFAIGMEDTYHDKKDVILNQLSKQLSFLGLICEIEYKNGKLILITSR